METTKEIREIQKTRCLSGDTLEDLSDRALDNIDCLLSKTKVFYFNDADKAKMNIGLRVDAAIKKLGIDMEKTLNNAKTSAQASLNIDKELSAQNIVIENRTQHENDMQNGMYLCKNNEIVFFISNPKINKLSISNQDRYYFRTNIFI